MINGFPEKPPTGNKLYVVVGDDLNSMHGTWLYDLLLQDSGTHKGIIQMENNIVKINASDTNGLQNAKTLFLRFAEMARVESLYN